MQGGDLLDKDDSKLPRRGVHHIQLSVDLLVVARGTPTPLWSEDKERSLASEAVFCDSPVVLPVYPFFSSEQQFLARLLIRTFPGRRTGLVRTSLSA